MIREIMRDILFLSKPSVKATAKDKNVAKDLLDTLQANADSCVGMAANMIGVNKRIIVFNTGLANVVMYNPTIIAKNGAYPTEEGCLSLTGVRTTIRYREITVVYQDSKLRMQKESFSGFVAQIIQHECDHLDGIII